MLEIVNFETKDVLEFDVEVNEENAKVLMEIVYSFDKRRERTGIFYIKYCDRTYDVTDCLLRVNRCLKVDCPNLYLDEDKLLKIYDARLEKDILEKEKAAIDRLNRGQKYIQIGLVLILFSLLLKKIVGV